MTAGEGLKGAQSLRWLAVKAMCAIGLAVLVGSCGSGGVSNDSDPEIPFLLSPATVTAYSGVPVTFTISGGGNRGPYQVTSSNPSLLAAPSQPVSATQFTLTPSPVVAEPPNTVQPGPNTVTLTIRDQAGKIATASAKVNPNFISSDITVTGTAPVIPGTVDQLAACREVGTVCAGQPGRVVVTISENGAPARGRVVRFDVVQGSYRFPTDIAQTLFATSITVTADEQGRAQAILRADANASFQVATIRATDVSTGAFRTSSFIIRSGSQFSLVPSSVAIKGTTLGICPGSSLDFLIFGGTPPYTIRTSAPATHGVFPSTTAVENPSRFNTTFPDLSCGTAGYEVVYTVTDASGLTIQATLKNEPGTGAPRPEINLSAPNGVTVRCGQQVQVLVTLTNGGTPPPTITTSIQTGMTGNALTAVADADGVITITRNNPTPPATSTTIAASLSSPASVVIGAGSAAPRTLSVFTDPSCP